MRKLLAGMRCLRHAISATLLALLLIACGSDDVVDDVTLEPTQSATQASSTPAGESTPASATGRTSTVILETSFDDDLAPQLFFQGESEFGARAVIVDGAYAVEVEDGEWQTIAPGPMAHPNDGVIEADITMYGNGFAGLVARRSTDADGNSWMYVCMVDDTGWAGCVATVGDTYDDLFWGEVEGYTPGAPIRMQVSVVGDQIALYVNQRQIGWSNDARVETGAWGLFAESQSETTTTVVFDNLIISTVAGGDSAATDSTEHLARTNN